MISISNFSQGRTLTLPVLGSLHRSPCLLLIFLVESRRVSFVLFCFALPSTHLNVPHVWDSRGNRRGPGHSQTYSSPGPGLLWLALGSAPSPTSPSARVWRSEVALISDCFSFSAFISPSVFFVLNILVNPFHVYSDFRGCHAGLCGLHRCRVLRSKVPERNPLTPPHSLPEASLRHTRVLETLSLRTHPALTAVGPLAAETGAHSPPLPSTSGAPW